MILRREIVAAGLDFLPGLDGAQLAIEAKLHGPDIGLALFESGKLFVVSHARHSAPGVAVAARYHSENSHQPARGELRDAG